LQKKRRAAATSPLSGEQKVDGLARGIDCPVQVFPLAFDFDVGLVYAPPASTGAFMPAKPFIQ